MKFTVLRFAFCALVAITLSLNALAQTAVGVIKAARVTGEVTKISGGNSVQLKNGDTLTENDAIKTGTNGGVVLVFMNGSTIKLGPTSHLRIDEFKMDPLGADINVANLKTEPSVSKTRLQLTEGELVGNVKTLNRAQGSEYSIRTPVGAAGIRGTTFRIVYRPTSDGKAFTFQLSTAEGVVLFEGTATTAASGIEVSGDQEIVVTATVDPTTGAITVSAPESASPISAEAAQSLQTATAEIVQTQQQTVFTPADQQGGNPPPPPQPPAPDLTPGAGK
jgi:hypothetical protein